MNFSSSSKVYDIPRFSRFPGRVTILLNFYYNCNSWIFIEFLQYIVDHTNLMKIRLSQLE